MDIWRYSDWWGLGAEVRNSQKHIWHWRDWIIESLNADKGYDQMVREMLAADELYPDDLDRLRATGFLARQYFKFNRNTWLDETVEHTVKAFLGLTFNCAKCHDHKYDPISQDDYYRFRAFFEPYQVRTDMVPGETDFEKDGIPRAFDCNLDAPTYPSHPRRRAAARRRTGRSTPGLPRVPDARRARRSSRCRCPPRPTQPGLRPFVLEDLSARPPTADRGGPRGAGAARRRSPTRNGPSADGEATARPSSSPRRPWPRPRPQPASIAARAAADRARHRSRRRPTRRDLVAEAARLEQVAAAREGRGGR